MHVEWAVAAAGAATGFLVGLTGSGGGALVTPLLVVVFGVHPQTAVATDLVAALAIRPAAAAVHLRRGNVDLRLAGRLSAGSVPAVLVGTAVAAALGPGRGAARGIDLALGGVLVAGAAAMSLRGRRGPGRRRRSAGGRSAPASPRAAVAVGAGCGLLVGATSVGSGSLMVVALLLVVPGIDTRSLIGSDLAQAVPLTAAAALGAIAFGHPDASLAASLALGAVPLACAGALLATRVPARLLAPVLTTVTLAAGLRILGLGDAAVVAAAGAALLAVTAVTLATTGTRLPPAEVT